MAEMTPKEWLSFIGVVLLITLIGMSAFLLAYLSW